MSAKGKPLRSFAQKGEKIRHKTEGTEAVILGIEQLYSGKMMTGFRVKCLDDGVERFLPFETMDQFEVVEELA